MQKVFVIIISIFLFWYCFVLEWEIPTPAKQPVKPYFAIDVKKADINVEEERVEEAKPKANTKIKNRL